MALRFGAATGDNVSVTAASSIDDLAAFTILTWVRFTSNPSSRRMVSKDSVLGGWSFNLATTSRPRLNVGRVITNAAALSSLNVSTNTWYYLAATFDEADGPRIFGAAQGLSSNVAVAELAYTTRTVGVGATTNPAAGTALIVGNFPTLDNAISADIARIAIFGRRMSLAEIRRNQWRIIPDADLRMWHEYYNTSSVVDLSGGLNTGTPTGLTVAPHAPTPFVSPGVSGWRGEFLESGGAMQMGKYWGVPI